MQQHAWQPNRGGVILNLCDSAFDSILPLFDLMILFSFSRFRQSLVNLMLTGNAVSHVWDLERDVGGLSMFYCW